jgi:hypothetical protein
MAEKDIRHAAGPPISAEPAVKANSEREVQRDTFQAELGEQTVQTQHSSSSLPLPSKARTIALVVTLTGVCCR